MAFGVCTNCLSSFPPSTGQKWKILQKKFYIVTTHNDEICYIKHGLALFMLFSPYLGVGGGCQGGQGTTCLCSFPTSTALPQVVPAVGSLFPAVPPAMEHSGGRTLHHYI